MSFLLSEILRDRWLISQQHQDAYFPVVLQLLTLAERRQDFTPVTNKGDLVLDFFGKDGVGFGIGVSQESLPEHRNFAAGADYIRKQLPEAPESSVAVIPIKGEFMRYGTICAWGADEIAPVIALCGDYENISAVVLDVDSGGGAERAVPPFLQAIKYVQSKKKPVVVHGDMVASAAYYVASYADYIVADNDISSAFGSIGVMTSWPDFREYYKKLGVTINDFYAPQSKKKNFAYREILEGREDAIKAELEKAANKFISNVKRERKNKFSDNPEIFEGALFEHQDILKHGLADSFGNLIKAVDIASALAESYQ